MKRRHAIGMVLLGASAALAADPAWYRRKGTWHETLLASRRALRASRGDEAPSRPLPDLGRDDFTVLAWVRTTRGGTILAKAPAKGKWAPQGKSLFVSGGRLTYDIGWVGAVASRRGVADGKWHHVALAKRSRTLRMYVDGAADASEQLEGEPDVRGHVLKIGYTSTNFPEQRSAWSGELDEVRLYARVLTAAEIQAHAAGRAPKKGLPAAYWPLDGDAADASGSRHHAGVVGRVAWADGKVGRALKVGGRGWLAVAAGAGDAWGIVWSLLGRDFPDAAPTRQMAWEREDGLWPGGAAAEDDWAALARRYAKACRRAPLLARRAETLAATVRDAAGLRAVRELYVRSRAVGEALATVRGAKPVALRRAIEYLGRRFGEAYDARGYLARLDGVERALLPDAAGRVAPEAVERAPRVLAELRREALLTGNPLMRFDKLLFVRRYTYQSSHFYTDFIDGCAKFGGNLCVLDLKTGKVRQIVRELTGGIFGRYDPSFDAGRIVFDWKAEQKKGFRLYEVGVDGGGLRQLTFEPPDEAQRVRTYDNSFLGGTGRRGYDHHTDDMHPCYLPGGGFCFTSTRCEYGTLCDAPDILSTAVLYRVDADGANLRKLTNSSVSEFSPSMMPDGRILYARWEYIDKGQIGVKCLWAMRPDGTGSVEIFGNNHSYPPTLIHGRNLPGRTDRFVVLGTPHYPQTGVGTVIRLDINYPARTRTPMTYITPDVDIRTEGGFHHRIDGRWVRTKNGPLYMDPYPLDEKFFLVSHNPDRPWNDMSAYGLYLLDEFGNHVLVYQDPEFSCWQPMPLRPRPRPPVLARASERQPEGTGQATVLITDVYEGLTGVARGTIKYVRVMEQVPRPWACRRFWDQRGRYNRHTSLISRGPVLGLKVLHGIVPVEADGSAYFTVPTDRNLYLQVLDEDFLEVQRMRTYVNFRPGEVRGCIGCHESRRLAPVPKVVLALRHGPVAPAAQPGETAPRAIHYPADVQPILDRHCVRCHGGESPKARLDLTGEPTTLFSRSYENLLRRGLVKTFDEGSDWGGIPAEPPRSVGSHASRLVAHLRKGHSGVKLLRAEWIKLATWVDANAQYYGTYYGRKNLRYRGHPDFRPTPTYAHAVRRTAPKPGAE